MRLHDPTANLLELTGVLKTNHDIDAVSRTKELNCFTCRVSTNIRYVGIGPKTATLDRRNSVFVV